MLIEAGQCQAFITDEKNLSESESFCKHVSSFVKVSFFLFKIQLLILTV